MKLLFVALMTVLLLSFAFAQPTFLGIKVEGSVFKIVEKLEAQGYTKISDLDEIIGLIKAQDKINLIYFNYKNESLIWKAVVIKPSSSNWYTLKRRYFEMKDMLSIKYGAVNKEIEQFLSPYYDGDGYEAQAISLQKCIYASFWYPDTLSSILLHIWRDGTLGISYENEANSKLYFEIEKEKLFDGL